MSTDDRGFHQLRVPITGFALVCVWPGLNAFATHAEALLRVGWKGVLGLAALCASLWAIGVLAALPLVLSRRTTLAARFWSTATIGVFLLFSHAGFRAVLIGSFFPYAARAAIQLTLFGFLILVGWLCSRYEPVRTGVGLAAMLLLLLSAIQVASFIRTERARPLAVATIGKEAPRHFTGENVYYVILDGYAGQGALERYVGYDLDPFLRQMGTFGYVTMDAARSNHVTTYVSLAAMLEAELLATEKMARYHDRRRFYPKLLQGGVPPRVLRQVHAAGYDFIVADDFLCTEEAWLKCGYDQDNQRFFEVLANKFLAPTGLLGIVRQLLGQDRAPDELKILSDALPALRQRGRPVFVFVHQMSPHPPYLRSDCSVEPGSVDIRSWDGEIGRGYYANTIDCVNGRVLSLVRRLAALDPGAIVVFQADHGSGFENDPKRGITDWSDAALDERSSILNLVRVPVPCQQWLRRDLAQVNTMRLVLGCLERRSPEYVPERTVISEYDDHRDYGLMYDATARLARIPARDSRR